MFTKRHQQFSIRYFKVLLYGNSSKRILVFIFRFYYYIVLFAHILTVMSPIITYPFYFYPHYSLCRSQTYTMKFRFSRKQVC